MSPVGPAPVGSRRADFEQACKDAQEQGSWAAHYEPLMRGVGAALFAIADAINEYTRRRYGSD